MTIIEQFNERIQIVKPPSQVQLIKMIDYIIHDLKQQNTFNW